MICFPSVTFLGNWHLYKNIHPFSAKEHSQHKDNKSLFVQNKQD